MGVTNKNKYCPVCNRKLMLDGKDYNKWGNLLAKYYICTTTDCKLLSLVQEFRPNKWVAYGEKYAILAKGVGVYGNV